VEGVRVDELSVNEKNKPDVLRLANERKKVKRKVLFSLALGMSAVISAPVALSQVRLETPEENQAPFYARVGRTIIAGVLSEDIYHDEKWAAIAFYRSPECVPSDFNLLDFFDFTPDPVFGLRVFGCPVTVEGFELWWNGPGIDEAPFHTRLSGLGAVPVWFVSYPALREAIADNVLTIGELGAMPSLRKGWATHFSETLNPFPAAKVTVIALEAQGVTEDGASFVFHAAASGHDPVCCSSDRPRQNVIIRFKK
jgi:hypothetical protein